MPAHQEVGEQVTASQETSPQAMPLKAHNHDQNTPLLVPVELPHAESKSSRLVRIFDVSEYQGD